MVNRCLKASTIVVYLIVLIACGGQPTLKNKSNFSADSWFEQGQTYWDKWEQDSSPSDLAIAHNLFKKSWEHNNSRLEFQHAYYLSSVYLGFYTESTNKESELLTLFNKLDPAVQSEVPPPARMLYAIGNFRNESANKLIPIVQRAIQQNPGDAVSWKQLSEQYFRQNQYHLASGAALKAWSIQPDSAEFAWQLGNSLAKQALHSGCEFNNELKRAAYYTSKAAVMQQDNAWWYANSAQRYVELGLLPLAHRQLQMALVIEPNAAYITAYIHASIIENKDFQTDDFITEVEKVAHNYDSFKALAMASTALGEWEHAREFLDLASEHKNLNTSDQLVYKWLETLLNSSSSFEKLLASNTSRNTREQAIVKLVADNSDKTLQQDQILAMTKNCYKQQLDFYIAMKNWRAGNKEKSLSRLKNAANNADLIAEENVWAAAFLQGFEYRKQGQS